MKNLNVQLDGWLAMATNVRLDGATQRIVAEALEKPLQGLSATPFEGLLTLERRVSHDGLVRIGGITTAFLTAHVA